MVPISKRALRGVSLMLIALPTFVFLFTWVKPVFSIPASLLLAAGCFCGLRRGRGKRQTAGQIEQETSYSFSVPTLLVIVGCALLWTFLAGQGGYFFQNEDHYGRNAILHDLLNHAWPVRFEGTSHALTYYLNYWIVPAALGKAAAALGQDSFAAANAVLFCQTTVFFTLLSF